MGRAKLTGKVYNGHRYAPVVFGGHNTGTKKQADQIASNLKGYKIPCRVVKADNGEYAVYRRQ
jgi:hypothetical protein